MVESEKSSIFVIRKGEVNEKPAVPPLGLLSGQSSKSSRKDSDNISKFKIMETKKSIFDIVFAVVICTLWVILGIAWVSSFDPASSFYLSVCFCAVCLFFLPVALVVMVAVMDYIDSRKK